MSNLGLGFMVAQGLNLVLITAWLVMAIVALIKLHKQHLNPTAKAVWALIVLIVPVAGSIVFLAFNPSEEL